MRKARFTAHQIIAVPESFETGHTAKAACREAEIPETSNDNWKAK